MSLPRAYSSTEITERFLAQLVDDMHFWARADLGDDAQKSPAQVAATLLRMDGLVHSILTLLDGGSVMPAMLIVPLPHSEDKADAIENDENWYPRNDALPALAQGALEAALHERWGGMSKDSAWGYRFPPRNMTGADE